MPGAAETLPYQQPFFIRVNVRRNLDGAKFMMHPVSEDDLKWLVPETREHPYLFIAKGHRPDFEELDLRRLAYIAELLTGLTTERMQSLGVRVVFMETRSDAILAEYPPA